MGKRPRSGGKGGRGGQTDTGRQLGKQEASKHAARMLAQKTRLQRAVTDLKAGKVDAVYEQARQDALDDWRDNDVLAVWAATIFLLLQL